MLPPRSRWGGPSPWRGPGASQSSSKRPARAVRVTRGRRAPGDGTTGGNANGPLRGNAGRLNGGPTSRVSLRSQPERANQAEGPDAQKARFESKARGSTWGVRILALLVGHTITRMMEILSTASLGDKPIERRIRRIHVNEQAGRHQRR